MDRKARTSFSVIMAMMILVIALVYSLFVRPNFHKVNGGKIDFDTVYVGQLNQGTGEMMYTMDDYLYGADQEGMNKYSSKGESIWNKSYHFDNPYYMAEAPFMAVVDLGGKACHIFDADGVTASIQTDYMIVGASLNKTGYLTLILEKDDQNYIDMYDSTGTQYISRRTFFKEDGYPIDVAMSDDGTRMLTSHLNVNNHMVESTVTFLDLSSSGEVYEDRITGYERLSDTLVTRVIFLEDHFGVVIGDNLLRFYNVEKTPVLLNELPVYSEINAITHTDDLFVVSYGEAMVPQGEEMANTVVVYDAEGVEQDRYKYESEVTGLSADDKNFYVISSSHVISYQSGKKQWETELHKPIGKVYHINNDRYLLIFDYDYEVVEIRDV